MMRYCLGNLYFRSGRLDEALSAYGEVLKFDPKDYKVFKVRGDIYLRKEDFESVQREYGRCVELAPSYDASLFKTLGIIRLFHFHDREGAREYFSKYLKYETQDLGAAQEIDNLERAGSP